MESSGRRRGGREPDRGPTPNSAEFNRVFTELLPRLRRAAVSLTGSPVAADDIVHDAYLRISRRPERFLGHPQPYAYAFTTMANLVRDQWRRERRRATLSESAAEEHAVADPLGGGLGELLACWEVARLLDCLTAKQARVVRLVDLAGYSVDEAAALLGVHRSTLAVTRRRALTRLRVVLEREGGRGWRATGGGRRAETGRRVETGREAGCPGGRPARNPVERPAERVDEHPGGHAHPGGHGHGHERHAEAGRARPARDAPLRAVGWW
ncbi:RNA polymerase sigma factor [Kitasatospora sp. NPDC059327]|uniref:RNA polymerase sigma factor n=1 Tax=Kitasatospora sp. NPDC059327 TaxID=3346803 RepID=UPI0036D00DF6